MSIDFQHCPILCADVIVSIDLEGNLKTVIVNDERRGQCPELTETMRCVKKTREMNVRGIDGKVIDVTTDPRGTYCEFWDPRTMWGF